MYREGSGAPLITATGEVVTRRKPVISNISQLDYAHQSNDQFMANNNHTDILDGIIGGSNYFKGMNLGGLNGTNHMSKDNLFIQKNLNVDNQNEQSKF